MTRPGCFVLILLGFLHSLPGQERDLENHGCARGDTESQEPFRLVWNHGLEFETGDKKFRLHLGGRLYSDWLWTWSDEDRNGFGMHPEPDSRVLIRKARIDLWGTLHENILFRTQYEFASSVEEVDRVDAFGNWKGKSDGEIAFKDIYLALKGVPLVGTFKVGQFKEPFGLEELTGGNFITFMERSLVSAFTPSRSSGLLIHNQALGGQATWAAGVFRDSDLRGNLDAGSTGSEYSFTGRFTFSPGLGEDGRNVLHLGVSASHRNPNRDSVRFGSRPEMLTKNLFVDTGDIPSEAVNLLGGEVAVVLGPLSAQAEYVHAGVEGSGTGTGDPVYSGWYAEASFFLTGEHRPYIRETGLFGRVLPQKNFGFSGSPGPGAIQVAARVSGINLNETISQGGELRGYSLGINWHLNPNTRIMVDFVQADRDRLDPVRFFGMRFQVDF